MPNFFLIYQPILSSKNFPHGDKHKGFFTLEYPEIGIKVQGFSVWQKPDGTISFAIPKKKLRSEKHMPYFVFLNPEKREEILRELVEQVKKEDQDFREGMLDFEVISEKDEKITAEKTEPTPEVSN